jgi:chemotaxis protein methyltransferase WspC
LEAAAVKPAAPLDVPAPVIDLLARARLQADSGQLGEALATCQTHLSQSSPSADAFSLLGVIHQARHEREEAVRCYQRALYLEPGHRNALTHLMLLCREQGDHAQAERLRRRLDRPASGGEA